MAISHENVPILSDDHGDLEIQKITAGVILACLSAILGVILASVFLGS